MIGRISEKQRDSIHKIVTETIDAGATLVEGGTYEGLLSPNGTQERSSDLPRLQRGDLCPSSGDRSL